MPTPLDYLQQAYANYTQILLLVTQVIANPTQAGIDAALSAARSANVVRPKLTYGLDGESYDWTGYQTFITNQLLMLKKTIAIESGPYQVESYGV
jgi:hypothetical protein